jgi:TonB family protein
MTYGALAVALVVLACDAPGPQSPAETAVNSDPEVAMQVDVPDALAEDAVDQVPERVTCPIPLYPRLMKEAGIEGQVLVQAVVDTSGHVIPGSIETLESSHLAFRASGEALLSACEFRPGMKDGEAVPVIIQMPVLFRLRTGSDSETKTRIDVAGQGAVDDPLFIVDGVIVGDRSMIDFEALDVERIEVIKGQAAESLYGERAKNGVVQITTKK